MPNRQSSQLKCGHTVLEANCGECQELKAKWYKRLEDNGFNDAEQADGNLKQWATSIFAAPSHHNPTAFQAKEEYYRLAGQFLYEHNFDSALERSIWKYHAEGVSVYKIPDLLKRKGATVPKRARVHQIIQKLVKEMVTKLK